MYTFHTGTELLKITQQYKIPISETIIRYEENFSGSARNKVIERMQKRLDFMRKAIDKTLKHPEKSVSGMTGEATPLLKKLLESKKKPAIFNQTLIKAATYAVATSECNACMGCIVACPTAGASGVVPGVILSLAEELKLKEKDILAGLFTSAGIGLIIAENATLAGSEGGCQAEIGSATAMAAAAATEMLGGTPEQALNAAALALKNLLGLSCDPIGGMVEVPCVKRNAFAAIHSLTAAQISLAGIKSFIPFDQVVDAMSKIGKLISPKLRETALGGLAVTPAGQAVVKRMGIKIVNGNGIE